ncbi:MAG: adenosylcobinamide-phosphate synthase CbiB [Devosiaceae bacterium]|nr:adenosylcobinamide-phosphate synthase CbiB [Devosiaceae bacterium]
MSFTIAFLALAVDRFFPLFGMFSKWIRHPVEWQGMLISFFERRWNDLQISALKRKRAGIFMLLILIVVTLLISFLLLFIFSFLPFSWIFEALAASVLLAGNDLKKAVASVAENLDISIEEGRKQVSHIVGRDTKNLNEHEISRAAIESLAENSSDGVIAPLFWLVIFGLPGIAVYKAINTADSMVGHLSERYENFGWASARTDDLVNWLPARLSALLYAVAAYFLSPEAAKNSLHAAINDAPNHTSPNAGWPEAALAGALGFGLGGPRKYGGKTLDLAMMGAGKRDLTSKDIFEAIKLYSIMSGIALVLVGFLALLELLF